MFQHLDHFSLTDLVELNHSKKGAQEYSTLNHYCSTDAGDVYLKSIDIHSVGLNTVFVCLILHRRLNDVISALTELLCVGSKISHLAADMRSPTGNIVVD